MATFKVIGIGEDSKYMDDLARYDVISYIMRTSKTTHFNKGGMSVNPDNAYTEMEILAGIYNKDSGVRLRHWVISFTKKEMFDPHYADMFAREAIQYYGREYQIVYAVHEDTEYFHIHFVMNQISFRTGRRYKGKKQDFHGYLTELNRIANNYGTYVIYVKGEQPSIY